MNRTVEEVVTQLGCKTPDEIRALLVAKGIKGIRGQACDCPIAVYIGREVQIVRIKAYPWSNITWRLLGRGWESIDTPESVGMFISSFDNKEFPELIA